MINELALVPVHPSPMERGACQLPFNHLPTLSKIDNWEIGWGKMMFFALQQCISKLSRTNIPNSTGIQSYSRKISNGWFCWSASCHYAMICKKQKRALSLTKRALLKTYVYQNIYQKRKDWTIWVRCVSKWVNFSSGARQKSFTKENLKLISLWQF